jgi:hypothetical protein
VEAERVVAAVADTLKARGVPAVPYADVARIEAVERERAKQLRVEEFKFASNREMLEVLRG